MTSPLPATAAWPSSAFPRRLRQASWVPSRAASNPPAAPSPAGSPASGTTSRASSDQSQNVPGSIRLLFYCTLVKGRNGEVIWSNNNNNNAFCDTETVVHVCPAEIVYKVNNCEMNSNSKDGQLRSRWGVVGYTIKRAVFHIFVNWLKVNGATVIGHSV